MVDLSRRGMLTGSWRNVSARIRPPWSKEDFHLLAHCLRCGVCIQVCETDILQRGQGGYPSVSFKHGECSLYYACAEACPESSPLPRHARAWDMNFMIGENCLAYQSAECHHCQDSCESMVITFRPTLPDIYQPQLDNQDCNGRGACVAICPVSVTSAEHNHGQ